MIRIIDLKKKFDRKWVTKGVNLDIPEGQMTCIIGRSGEGKSVLLKQIIGLIQPTSGKVVIDNIDITQLSEREKIEQFRKFGYVFQFSALLDSLNIFENIGITLLEQGIKQKEVLPIVTEQLKLVNLSEDTLYKYPSELSGGMRKRVGILRALITNPKIVLYDEPTTGLDPITSRVTQNSMLDMQKRQQVTSIIVTHDVSFFDFADNVALLYDGKIQYYGPAKTIWQETNPYVYQFIRGLTEGPMQTEVPQAKDKY